MNTSDRELVSRAVAGDRVALDRLLYRNYDRLLRHIDVRLPPAERGAQTAEDIAQEAMMVAARDIRTFTLHSPTESGFAAWLLTIAEHRMLDYLKNRRAKKRGGDATSVPFDPEDDDIVALLALAAVQSRTPSRVASHREAIDAVMAALERLPADHREIVTMYFMQEMTFDAISAKLGRSEGAVRMACKRGLADLRKHVGDPSRFLSRTG